MFVSRQLSVHAEWFVIEGIDEDVAAIGYDLKV